MRKVKTHSEWQRIFAWVNCGFITWLYRNAEQKAWRYELVSEAGNQSWTHRTKKASYAVSMKSRASRSRKSGRSWIFLQVNLQWDAWSKQWLYVEKEISLRKWAWPGSMCRKSVGNGEKPYRLIWRNIWYFWTKAGSIRTWSVFMGGSRSASVWRITPPLEHTTDDDRAFLDSIQGGKGFYNLSGWNNKGTVCLIFERDATSNPTARRYRSDEQSVPLSCQSCPGRLGTVGHRGALPASLQSRFQPHWKMWSKLKSILRSWKIRTLDALPDAISRALSLISHLDCQHWFDSCYNTERL